MEIAWWKYAAIFAAWAGVAVAGALCVVVPPTCPGRAFLVGAIIIVIAGILSYLC